MYQGPTVRLGLKNVGRNDGISPALKLIKHEFVVKMTRHLFFLVINNVLKNKQHTQKEPLHGHQNPERDSHHWTPKDLETFFCYFETFDKKAYLKRARKRLFNTLELFDEENAHLKNYLIILRDFDKKF